MNDCVLMVVPQCRRRSSELIAEIGRQRSAKVDSLDSMTAEVSTIDWHLSLQESVPSYQSKNPPLNCFLAKEARKIFSSSTGELKRYFFAFFNTLFQCFDERICLCDTGLAAEILETHDSKFGQLIHDLITLDVKKKFFACGFGEPSCTFCVLFLGLKLRTIW